MNLSDQEFAELKRLREEVTTLKALLPALSSPCGHCGVDNMAKCPNMLQGCKQAEDLLIGQEHALKRVLRNGRRYLDTLEELKMMLSIQDELSVLEEECLEKIGKTISEKSKS